MTAITDNTNKQQTRRKVAAVLAGGLVLGVGTAATLASWNDSEYATATFTAGKFVFEGALDQTTFSEHATTGAAAALTFSTPFNNMTPNDVVYAGYAVRLGAGTTNNATVALSNTATGSYDQYQYTVFTTATAGCSASAVAASTLVAASDLGSGTGSFNVTKGSPTTAAGATVYLCFKVTADASVSQAATSTVTWRLNATSAAS